MYSFIPKDAGFVTIIYPDRFQQKLDEAHMNWDSLMVSFLKEESDSASGKNYSDWENFKNAGLDLDKGLVLFSTSEKSVELGRATYFVVAGNLTSASDFKIYIQKLLPEKEVVKAKAYEYISISNKIIAAWNKEIVLVTMAESASNYAPGTLSNGQGTLSQLYIDRLFQMDKENSIVDIDRFLDLTEEDGDMLYWINSSVATNKVSVLGITRIGELLNNNYVFGKVNFEKGMAQSNYTMVWNEKLAEIINKYPVKKIDQHMIAKYPFAFNGFVLFSMNPGILMEIIQYAGIDIFLAQTLNNLGFTLEDVKNAIQGEVAIIFSDFEHKRPFEPDAYTGGIVLEQPKAKFIMNVAIADNSSIHKITQGLVEKGILKNQGNSYVPSAYLGKPFYVELTDSNLLISSSDSMLQAYKSSAKSTVLEEHMQQQIEDKSFAMYVDLQTMLRSVKLDSANQAPIAAAINTFNYISITSGNTASEGFEGIIQLKTMHDAENSLATLVKYFSHLQSVSFENRYGHRNIRHDETVQ